MSSKLHLCLSSLHPLFTQLNESTFTGTVLDRSTVGLALCQSSSISREGSQIYYSVLATRASHLKSPPSSCNSSIEARPSAKSLEEHSDRLHICIGSVQRSVRSKCDLFRVQRFHTICACQQPGAETVHYSRTIAPCAVPAESDRTHCLQFAALLSKCI